METNTKRAKNSSQTNINLLIDNLHLKKDTHILNEITENRFLSNIFPKRISEIEKQRSKEYFDFFVEYKKILPKYLQQEGIYGYISELTKAKRTIYELYFKDWEEKLNDYNIRNISPFLNNAIYPIFVAIPKKIPLTEFGIVKGEKIAINKISIKMRDEVAKKFKSKFSEYVLIIADEFIPISEQIYEPEILLSRTEIEEIFEKRYGKNFEVIDTILLSLISSPHVGLKGGNASSLIIPQKLRIENKIINKLNEEIISILPNNMVYPIRKIKFSDIIGKEEEREILPRNFVLMKDSGIRFSRFLRTRNVEKYAELQNVIEISPFISLPNYKLSIDDKYVNYSEGFFIANEKTELAINEKSKDIFKMKEVIVNSVNFYQSRIRSFNEELKPYEEEFLKMRNKILEEFSLPNLLKGRFLASDGNIDGRFGFAIKYAIANARFNSKIIVENSDIKTAMNLQCNFIKNYISSFDFTKLKEFDKDLEETKSQTLKNVLKIISEISATNIAKEFSFIDVVNEGTKNYGIKIEKINSALDELERRGDIRKVREGKYKMTEV